MTREEINSLQHKDVVVGPNLKPMMFLGMKVDMAGHPLYYWFTKGGHRCVTTYMQTLSLRKI